MQSVYTIVENGISYPNAYVTYSHAVAAVKARHKEYLEERIQQLHYLEDIEAALSDINVPENVEKSVTQLYIEKGINIIINKLTIIGIV